MERKGLVPPVTHDGGAKEIEARLHQQLNYLNTTSAALATNQGTDLPKHVRAPQPVDHLLTALVECAHTTALFVGRSMHPPLLIQNVDFDLVSHRDGRGSLQMPIDEIPSIPSRLQYVAGMARVSFQDGHEVCDEQMKILAMQTEARCPIANMILASGCIIDIRWVNAADTLLH